MWSAHAAVPICPHSLTFHTSVHHSCITGVCASTELHTGVVCDMRLRLKVRLMVSFQGSSKLLLGAQEGFIHVARTAFPTSSKQQNCSQQSKVARLSVHCLVHRKPVVDLEAQPDQVMKCWLWINIRQALDCPQGNA